MVSPSTSSTHKSFKYDVFLSFRGEDTRTNFVDHLYAALQHKGIYTYKDDVRIKKGKRINDELIGSIEDSRFYIIVFSKNYASSSWCLDELVKIMECHKTTGHAAYPIFYDVEPTEVRKQIGAVGEAFAKHEKEEDVRKCREAMKEASDLAGWELKRIADGHEAKFIQKLVEEISLELRSINFSADEILVGMESRVKDVLSYLETGVDDVSMMGIKGMGGAGKTTLARAIFDQIAFRFEGKSFVENVREVSKASSSGLSSLQKKVISDVLNDQNINIGSVYDGKNMMKMIMRCRKVLVVLDDVDHIEQLEALVGDPDWFKEGSKIIITTRYEQVLVAHGVKLIRNVNLLSDDESACLFRRYAFVREVPIQGYEKLLGQVVRYAAGLPLTIKVLGSFLCGKDESEWIDAIERLKTIPLEETLKRLEISYIDLEDDYKEIFLDLACILKGRAKKDVIEALESCGFHARNGLRVLEQRSLITLCVEDTGEYVDMHDHIEEMGRNIVRRPLPANKHSRLWKEDEIVDILTNDLGTEATICLDIYTSKLNPKIIMKGLRKMKKLRFLNVHLKDGNQGSVKLIPKYLDALGFGCCNWNSKKLIPYFPDTLKYLCWEGYPCRSLPKTFQANNLVSLKMAGSKIVQFWEGGERKVLNKLKILDLSSSMFWTLELGLTPNLETLTLEQRVDLVEFPHTICMLKQLKSLKLDGCLLLNELPEDLGQLENLVTLGLSHTNIKHLPDSICMLKHLKTLNLGYCSRIEKLPKDLGLLECLEILTLSYTKIKYLPDSICMLKHLKTLNLGYCSRIEKLPKDLGLLECLEMLTLSYTKIKYLPDSICMLKHLKTLNLGYCSRIEKLPKDLGLLECLEMLTLSYTKIKYLPDSICMLKHLEFLGLESCSLLEKLPEELGRLECLERLNISHTRIKNLPDSICILKHLEYLDASNCWLLENLPEDLGQLETLRDLDFSNTQIKHLPEDLAGIACLEKINLSYTQINYLPDSICMLKHLRILSLYHCLLLEKLPEDLGRLECLRMLVLSYTKTKYLPDSICRLKHLQYLYLDHCLLLEKLPKDIGRLERLRMLDIEGTCISRLPHSIFLLKGLHIYGSIGFLQSCGFTSQIQRDRDSCYVKV